MRQENSPCFVPDVLDGRQLVPYLAFCRAFRFAGRKRRKVSDDGSSNSHSKPLATAFPRLAACRGCAVATSLGMLREGTSALPIASGSSSEAAAPWPPKSPASPQFRHDGDSRDIDFPTDPALDAMQCWRRLASDKNAEHQECRLHDLRIEMVWSVGMKRQAAGAGALPAWIEKLRLDLLAGATFMPLATVVSGKIRAWGAVAESRVIGVRCNA